MGQLASAIQNMLKIVNGLHLYQTFLWTKLDLCLILPFTQQFKVLVGQLWANWVECLAQQHIDIWTGGAGVRKEAGCDEWITQVPAVLQTQEAAEVWFHSLDVTIQQRNCNQLELLLQPVKEFIDCVPVYKISPYPQLALRWRGLQNHSAAHQ